MLDWYTCSDPEILYEIFLSYNDILQQKTINLLRLLRILLRLQGLCVNFYASPIEW